MKRIKYLIEFGQGIDFHGEDPSRAVCKAVEDAVSHCCLSGMMESPAMQIPGSSVEIAVHAGVPHHAAVDTAAIPPLISAIPAQVRVTVEEGGLAVTDVCESDGSVSHILMANAAITLWIVTP